MFEIIALRLVHILGGIFWVGAALFSAFFLLPALTEAGPSGGAIMQNFQRRRLFVVMPTVALLTILSGLRLMWITSGGFSPAYFATGRGATFAASGTAAILAFLLGLLVVRPLAARMGALRQSLAPQANTPGDLPAQLDRLQRRSTAFSAVITALLVLAAAGMAIGRYVI